MRIKIMTLLLLVLLPYTGKANDYFNAHGEEDTKYIMRLKLGWTFPSYNATFKQNGTTVTRTADDLVDSFLAFDTEFDYRYTDYVTFGASLGYLAQESFTWSSQGLSDEGNINSVPVGVNVKFFPAPYGQIRPYVGAGVHYTMIQSKFDGINTDHTSGLLFQLGFDWWTAPEWGVNFDIKKYMIATDVDFSGISGNNNLTAEIETDPLVFSAGMGYRF